MKQNVKDMTTGSPFRLILGFVIPMMLGMLFQQFYNMVDAMVVGKYLGVNALAGVGSTGSINFMIVGFSSGLAAGFAIPVAQRFGAKDEEALRRYVANGIYGSILFILPVSAVSALLCRKILEWTKTPEDIFEYAFGYIFVIFLGIPILYAYNLLAYIIRALGDSKSPVYFLIFSVTVNIVLDLWFVLGLHTGVVGPAVATLISQGISVLLCLWYIRKKFPILHLSKEDCTLRWNYVGHLLSVGLPMGLQYSITAIGGVVLQSAVNSLGSSYVAAMSTGNKMNLFAVVPIDALGVSMATYAGQNTGSGQPRRIDKGVFSAMCLGAGYSVIAFICLYFFGKDLALLFLDASEVEILDNVHLLLIIYSLMYILLCVVNIFRFAIQGMGYSTLAIFAGVLEMIARGSIGFGLVSRFGFLAACFASPFAWLLADAFLIPAYFICRRRLERQLAHTA